MKIWLVHWLVGIKTLWESNMAMDISRTKWRFWVGKIIQTCGFSSKPCLITTPKTIFTERIIPVDHEQSWKLVSLLEANTVCLWFDHVIRCNLTIFYVFTFGSDTDDYVWIYVVESVSCVSLMTRWTMKVQMAFPIGMMRYFYVHMSSAFGKSAVCATSLNTQQMTGVGILTPCAGGDVKEERPPLRLVLLWNHMNPQLFDVINAIQRPYFFVSSI